MIFRSRHAEFEAIRKEMEPKFKRENVRIIEAGCGRKWEYKLPEDVTPYIIGIDIDETAMQLRAALENDLDELHCCDLLDAKIPYASADIIYCSFVFEHLTDPPNVLRKFADWVADDGIIILRFPNIESVFGWTTRVSPHWIHVLYHRLVKGYKEAGKIGHPPYPTVYHESLKYENFHELLGSTGLEIKALYKVNTADKLPGLWKSIYVAYAYLLSLLSFGKIDRKVSSFAYVLKNAE